MTNGDRLTCEIKRLEYGQLHVKTEYALGTVVLDWEKIERVESSQRFVVETANGDYHTGLLRREASTSAAKAEQLEVVDNDVTTWLQHQETVQIEKLERSLIGKLDVKVDDERLHLYQGEQSNPVYLAGESGSEF